MFTIGEIIDLAIRIEKNGERTYRMAQEQVSKPLLASMLEWLASEEAEHEKWFINLREEMDVKIEDPRLEEMGRAILEGVLGDRAFSMDEADFSKMENIASLLELSLEFEKDTIIFYEMLRGFIDDEKVQRGIDKIIEEENRHVENLEAFVEKKVILPTARV